MVIKIINQAGIWDIVNVMPLFPVRFLPSLSGDEHVSYMYCMCPVPDPKIWSMDFGTASVPEFKNEPFRTYPPNSDERRTLLAECARIRASGVREIPCIVNGQEIKTGNIKTITMPSDHSVELFRVHLATKEVLQQAIAGSLKAKTLWMDLAADQRSSIFWQCASLLSKPWRDRINAYTMLNLGKTMWESEIDIGEICDFFRFNVFYMHRMYAQQPLHHSQTVWNKFEYRPLEGFVAAMSPFNFLSLACQLACVPTLVGNVVIWRTGTSTALACYQLYKLLEEGGIPPGVIQFVPCDSQLWDDVVISHPMMGGLHFTGSTSTFDFLWKFVGNRISSYRSYPKLVGETGGKNFHVLHPSGNVENFVATTIRGCFDYAGQKCSATSRAYVPREMWDDVRSRLIQQTEKYCHVGQPDDPSSFLSAVIDKRAFDRVKGYIDRARERETCEIVIGGTYDDSTGYFIHPTIILTSDPHSESIEEEIFGPVLTIYLYDDYDEVLTLCDSTSPYALTGAVYAHDRYAIAKALKVLRYSCGNMNINDKSTGAMCGQQLFGGARKSGTNDKTGSWLNLMRWTSPRTIKEQFRTIQIPQYPSTTPDTEQEGQE